MQQLTAPEGNARGLSLQFHALRANPDITTVDKMVTLGLVYRGPFASRPDDKFGIGSAWLHVSDRLAWGEQAYNAALPPDAEPLAVQNAEHSYTMFYHVQLLGSVYTSPELQYIVHPGGNRSHQNDLVLGLRTVFDF